MDTTIDGIVASALSESRHYDRAVTLDASDLGVDRDALCDALSAESDDSVETDARTEYWADGWRVHVAAEVRS